MTSSKGTHRVAVIGGGVAGLAAIKNCLEEGLHPTCFEQYDDIGEYWRGQYEDERGADPWYGDPYGDYGGLKYLYFNTYNDTGGIWYYSPRRRPHEGAGAFQNLMTNTSRETSSFTDFPIPQDYPLYMPHREFLKYLKAYADHFNLWPHIRFNSRVVRVAPADDYQRTGEWLVTVECEGRRETQLFQSVLVCNGMLVDPVYPDLPGEFQGEMMHMADYRSPEVFTGKRVLVIGNQHSAGDAVCDASSCCKQAYLSPGRGGIVVLPRLTPAGQSAEINSLNRLITCLVRPPTLGRMARSMAVKYMDYPGLNLQLGDNSFTKGVTMISDDLRYRLTTGGVKAVRPVKRYTSTGVELDDGRCLEVDMILLATGYKSNYDFIDVPCIKGHDFRLNCERPLCLYKWVFPVELPHPTLSLVDAYNVYGPHVGALEMRSRWVAAVLSGRCRLPDNDTMKVHQVKQYEYMEDVCNFKVKILWYEMCNDMAREIGAYPSFWRLFRHSPVMAIKVYLGPLIPQHYRLVGPGASAAAWQQCHELYDRMYPVKGRILQFLPWTVSGVLVVGLAYVVHHYMSTITS